MPRYFRPVGGFKIPNQIAVEISDDGYSGDVFKDGTIKPCGLIDRENRFQSTWTIAELDRLATAGAWEEIKRPAELSAATAPTDARIAPRSGDVAAKGLPAEEVAEEFER